MVKPILNLHLYTSVLELVFALGSSAATRLLSCRVLLIQNTRAMRGLWQSPDIGKLQTQQRSKCKKQWAHTKTVMLYTLTHFLSLSRSLSLSLSLSLALSSFHSLFLFPHLSLFLFTPFSFSRFFSLYVRVEFFIEN